MTVGLLLVILMLFAQVLELMLGQQLMARESQEPVAQSLLVVRVVVGLNLIVGADVDTAADAGAFVGVDDGVDVVDLVVEVVVGADVGKDAAAGADVVAGAAAAVEAADAEHQLVGWNCCLLH